MTATTGYELIKHYQYFTDEGLVMLGAGFVTAFIVARLTMRWFIRFLARFTFVSFGVYRILLGLALLIWFACAVLVCVCFAPSCVHADGRMQRSRASKLVLPPFDGQEKNGRA